MASATVTNIYYIIKSGDTLTSIAKKFSTTTNQLLIWNPKITDPNKIYAGSEIKIGQKDIKPIPTTIPTQEPTITPTVTPSNIPTQEPTIIPTTIDIKKNTDNSIYLYGIGIIAILFLFKRKGKKR
jgi:LysM repeat protein